MTPTWLWFSLNNFYKVYDIVLIRICIYKARYPLCNIWCATYVARHLIMLIWFGYIAKQNSMVVARRRWRALWCNKCCLVNTCNNYCVIYKFKMWFSMHYEVAFLWLEQKSVEIIEGPRKRKMCGKGLIMIYLFFCVCQSDVTTTIYTHFRVGRKSKLTLALNKVLI